MDDNYTNCGDHSAVYTNIKSSWCIPEINIIVYTNYTSIEKELKSCKLNFKE